jgi:uncharacterized RDD family membrane protein YckC
MSEYAAHTPHPRRAGFGDRAVALGIDILLVSLLIAVIGLALTGLTGGRVRVANIVVNSVYCTDRQPSAPAFPVPEGFDAEGARRCTRSVLGIAHDWILVVHDKTITGEDEKDGREVSIPIDAEGRPMRAFYVDSLIPFVLAAYLLLFEWRFGATLGKRLVGIRVQSLGGGPMDVVQAGKRTLIRLILILSAWATQTLFGSSTEAHRINFELTMSYGTPDLGF